MINGYKCFNKNLVNSYGKKFEVGKTYHATGDIVFGTEGNGYHMCKRLEDTLRYFDAMNEEFDICKVDGFGKCVLGEDNYNEYYDMYACEYMTIIKKLTREEIITYGLNLDELRIIRFVSSLKLSEEEKILFREKFQKYITVMNYIDYYQDGIKDAFTRKLTR